MKALYALISVVVLFSGSLKAQPNYKPTVENLKMRQSFQDDKFGLFIHWGLYAQLAEGEWVQHSKRIPVNQYEKLAQTFNPTQFNAEEWVLMAKAAGQKYVTITSKHHDGFCLFDSKLTTYDVVDATPFKRDIIKELALACQKNGIKLALYYSLLDWHHPDFNLNGEHGKLGFMGASTNGQFSNYVNYMCGQLKELLTNYGPIYTIWFDGEWESKKANWEFEKIYKTIHEAQPACLVGNNHHSGVKFGEDFQMFEKDLPGVNSHGWIDEAHSVSSLPLETCETMNGSWGYHIKDNKYKTCKNLIQYLTKAAGSNSNFLLNVGPMPNGKIQVEFADTLKKMGDWLSKFGPSIYKTRGNILRVNNSWGTATQSADGKIFLHILDRESPAILVQGLGKEIRSLKTYLSGDKVKFTPTTSGLVIEVSKLWKPQDLSLILVAE